MRRDVLSVPPRKRKVGETEKRRKNADFMYNVVMKTLKLYCRLFYMQVANTPQNEETCHFFPA